MTDIFLFLAQPLKEKNEKKQKIILINLSIKQMEHEWNMVTTKW